MTMWIWQEKWYNLLVRWLFQTFRSFSIPIPSKLIYSWQIVDDIYSASVGCWVALLRLHKLEIALSIPYQHIALVRFLFGLVLVCSLASIVCQWLGYFSLFAHIFLILVYIYICINTQEPPGLVLDLVMHWEPICGSISPPARWGLLDFIRAVVLLLLLLLLRLLLLQFLLDHVCVNFHLHFRLANSSPSSSPTSELSAHCWTSTWDLPSSVRTAGPQPRTFPAQCAPLDLNLGLS